ncbi:MAG TPA: hypothetical protein VKT33_09845 [Candidatus Angelobacter sp.]|nr:hypothetical protein [Candidatus Angelobacter sp.]
MSPRSGHGGRGTGRSSGKKQSGRSSRTTAHSSARGRSGGRASTGRASSPHRGGERSENQSSTTFAQGRGRTTQALNRVLTDHDEIRQWAEERQARPARFRVTGSGKNVGRIRLDLPGSTGQDTLEPVAWDDFFRKFDESNLAMQVQDQTASGERSNFYKLVKRQTATAAKRKKAA